MWHLDLNIVAPVDLLLKKGKIADQFYLFENSNNFRFVRVSDCIAR